MADTLTKAQRKTLVLISEEPCSMAGNRTRVTQDSLLRRGLIEHRVDQDDPFAVRHNVRLLHITDAGREMLDRTPMIFDEKSGRLL